MNDITSNRITKFKESKSACMTCIENWSQAPDGICYPCIFPCLDCFKLNNYSCRSCRDGYYIGNGR